MGFLTRSRNKDLYRLTDLKEVNLAEEAPADRDECFLRPLVEPINAGRVGDCRELATSHT